jgi:hypothetical protein
MIDIAVAVAVGMLVFGWLMTQPKNRTAWGVVIAGFNSVAICFLCWSVLFTVSVWTADKCQVCAVLVPVGQGAFAECQYVVDRNVKAKWSITPVTAYFPITDDCVLVVRTQLTLDSNQAALRAYLQKSESKELKGESISKYATRLVVRALCQWWATQKIEVRADFVRLQQEAEQVAEKALHGFLPPGTRAKVQLWFMIRPARYPDLQRGESAA